jgi:site-specific DNA-methyltransferase (adenine-specific)
MKKLEDYLYHEEKGPDLKIYCGDCNDILPLMESVDLVITDPPYGMNFQSNHRAVKHDKIANDTELPIYLIDLARSKASNASYFFCRWDNLYQMQKPKSVLAWVKNNWSMGDLEHEHGRQWEAICFYPANGHKFYERIPDVIKDNRTGNDFHPTQKPVGLIRRLIESNHGNKILDPFLGSGTTLVACKELNRAGIGIEISEKYCEIAKKRLMNTPKPMFTQHTQEKIEEKELFE